MFEEKKTYGGISFRYAKGPSVESGNEIHPYGEILYYMDGDATFLSESFSERLERGTLLIIPKGNYHNFRVENQESYKRFVINFGDVPAAHGVASRAMERVRIIKTPDRNMGRILERMCEVIRRNKEEEAAVFLYGAFLELLCEICIGSENAALPEMRAQDDLISRCIRYTDKNFTEEITAADVARKMQVSESTLVHCFKRELGISLHRYITEKRMIYARKLIENGENPTAIYAKCGYGDYSSFYKAYVKMFRSPPSADKRR